MGLDPDLDAFLDLVERCPLRHPNGWSIVAHAEFVDATKQRPRGVQYGIFLIDPDKIRCLGFDNHYPYDGAPADAAWDHEHRVSRPGRHYRYEFRDFWGLVAEFFERVTAHCQGMGLSLSDFRSKASEHD